MACEDAHTEVARRLGRVPANSQVTARALALIFDVAEGTIRSWASRYGWERTHNRPARYATKDVLASYDRLTATR